MIAIRLLERRPGRIVSAGVLTCSDAVATALSRASGARL